MKLHVGVLLLCFVAGCARFQHQPLSPVETADRLQERTLDNPAHRTFLEKNLHRDQASWPPASWDLEALTAAAFFYHPALDVARAQWAEAKAGKATASERPNPALNVTPGYNFTTATPSPWIPLGSLDLPIETAGKRGYRMAQ